eukprot:GHVT01029798.1.p1 GENE.GHVT01029798.1~~GHVT01029798.1.p1  ORF type:complete len:114 (+),score=26.94 GHVT01029798.1:340-681(+)
MGKVASRSVLLCLLTYTLMGVGGFAAYGAATDPNILNNLAPFLRNTWIVPFAFVCIAPHSHTHPISALVDSQPSRRRGGEERKEKKETRKKEETEKKEKEEWEEKEQRQVTHI